MPETALIANLGVSDNNSWVGHGFRQINKSNITEKWESETEPAKSIALLLKEAFPEILDEHESVLELSQDELLGCVYRHIHCPRHK